MQHHFYRCNPKICLSGQDTLVYLCSYLCGSNLCRNVLFYTPFSLILWVTCDEINQIKLCLFRNWTSCSCQTVLQSPASHSQIQVSNLSFKKIHQEKPPIIFLTKTFFKARRSTVVCGFSSRYVSDTACVYGLYVSGGLACTESARGRLDTMRQTRRCEMRETELEWVCACVSVGE